MGGGGLFLGMNAPSLIVVGKDDKPLALQILLDTKAGKFKLLRLSTSFSPSGHKMSSAISSESKGSRAALR
jgi:hypothetical protein